MTRRYVGGARVILLAAAFLWLSATSVLSQTTSFTYQGRLQDGGINANGNYDFRFTLWDSLAAGTQQPQPAPITVGHCLVVWMIVPSWMEVRSPIRISPWSPRSTALGQTDDPAPSSTFPMTTASGCTKASGSIAGTWSSSA